MAVSDEIIDVTLVTLDGDFVCTCPHCNRVITIGDGDISEVLGYRYLHTDCGGWLMLDKAT